MTTYYEALRAFQHENVPIGQGELFGVQDTDSLTAALHLVEKGLLIRRPPSYIADACERRGFASIATRKLPLPPPLVQRAAAPPSQPIDAFVFRVLKNFSAGTQRFYDDDLVAVHGADDLRAALLLEDDQVLDLWARNRVICWQNVPVVTL